ncbi:MAG: hypothetical protein LBS19_16035 [Clostridiales bacterium]|jgi:hypothetical protein|nr:hypothetical protein [Clostridiales bacterium]
MKDEKKKGKKTSNKLELFVYTLIIALLAVLLWPFITATVEAGHVGFYYSRFFGGTVTESYLPEGLQFLLPWDRIILYDARAQSKDYSVTGSWKLLSVISAVMWTRRPCG